MKLPKLLIKSITLALVASIAHSAVQRFQVAKDTQGSVLLLRNSIKESQVSETEVELSLTNVIIASLSSCTLLIDTGNTP